jgi:hypothetical protein
MINILDKKIDKNSYYYKYKRQAYLFEAAGIVGLGISILINELTGRPMNAPVLIIGGIGALLLIIGGSSAQPHVLIKSFAMLLTNEPTTKNALEFIRALEYSGSVRLVRRSQNLVNMAMMKYEGMPDADPEVTQKLKDAVKEHIRNKRF